MLSVPAWNAQTAWPFTGWSGVTSIRLRTESISARVVLPSLPQADMVDRDSSGAIAATTRATERGERPGARLCIDMSSCFRGAWRRRPTSFNVVFPTELERIRGAGPGLFRDGRAWTGR